MAEALPLPPRFYAGQLASCQARFSEATDATKTFIADGNRTFCTVCRALQALILQVPPTTMAGRERGFYQDPCQEDLPSALLC